MTHDKSTALQLVVSNEAAISKKPQTPPPEPISKKMVFHPDPVKAADWVAEQSGYIFDEKHAVESADLDMELDKNNRKLNISQTKIDEHEEKLANTEKLETKTPQDSTPWREWKPIHKIMLILTLTALCIAMLMGAGNVYSNLMASGSPVFIENPLLAAMLSTILPIASMAIKFISHFFHYQSTRRQYALAIFKLTLVSTGVWSVLFAINYPGVSAGFDWDSLGESNVSGSLLVWTQLVVELLAGSSLFFAAEKIYSPYFPEVRGESDEAIQIEKLLDVQYELHDQIIETLKDLKGRRAVLTAKRHRSINDAIADFMELRARHAVA